MDEGGGGGNAVWARVRTGAAGVVIVLSVAGCLGLDGPMKPEAAEARLDAAEALLTEAALRAETALTRLARVEADPSSAGEVPRIVPSALLRRVDLEWIGPIETVARKLAESAGFGFETGGAAPARPVMVEIRARRRPLIMVLRDAGLQAGAEVALTVDATRRLVVLDWTGEAKL